jgi:urea transport system permease protein
MTRSFLRQTTLLLSLLWIAIAGPVQAAEDDFATQLQALNAGSYAEKIAAVNAMAAEGDPRAADVLEGFLDRRLHAVKADGRVVLTTEADPKGGMITLIDPLTGNQTGAVAADTVEAIGVNNQLRGVIRNALGGLTLMSKDPDKRIASALAVFKSPQPHQIDTLRAALERETDSSVKTALQRALAAAEVAHGGTTAERVAGLGMLSRFADPEVNALLRNLLGQKPDGSFNEPDDKVREAATAAYGHIQTELALWDLVGKLFQGMSLASVLLLAAIGLAITFGVMGVINMAHGEMVMLGAYTTFVIQELIRTRAPYLFDVSLAFAIPAAFLVSGAFGVAIERGIIRFLYNRPLETLLATWGLSLMLQQMVRTIFGPTNREVGNPSWMTGGIELSGGVLLTYNRVWIIVFSLLVLGLLALLLKKTSFGLQMRAVTQNRRMASAVGIRTGWVDAMTFGLGSGIAGMAGVALSQIDNVSPNLGQSYIIDSFMVVVFGGIGNLLGTLFGAMTLGIANKFLEVWAGAVLAKIFVLIAVILFIQKRPRGLFALKGRAVEA